jgi:KUP system potassium uptake protein
MLITTLLLFLATREIWKWSLATAIALGAALAIFDLGFLAANMTKLLQGGWVPLALGAVVYAVMLTWRAGALTVQAQRRTLDLQVAQVVEEIATKQYPRVPGTAVFLARSEIGAPPILLRHLENNRSLHEAVWIIDVTMASVPYVRATAAIPVKELAPRLWLAEARFGFMERPDIPLFLERLRGQGYPLDPVDITYYLRRERVVAREDGRGLPRTIQAVFAFLQRNSVPLPDYFHVPRDRVVEIGRTFTI